MIGIIVLFVVCVGCWIMVNRIGWMEDDVWWVGGIISGLILVFALLLLLISPIATRGEIAEYYAVKATIEQARTDGVSSIERAAITQKIIETNKWLASVKYFNKHHFDIYIPDEVDDLEYLK